MSKSDRYYTLLVVPEHHEEKTISIRIAKQWITATLTLGVCFIAVLGFILFKTAEAARKMHQCTDIQNENALLKEENERLRVINHKIGHLDSVAEFFALLSRTPQQNGQQNGYSSSLLEAQTPPSGVNAPEAENAVKSVRNASDTASGTLDRSCPIVFPVVGWVTQQFLENPSMGREAHLGIDIAAAEGTVIKAPASGTVIDVLRDKDYGKMIVIKHNKIYTTRYGHCAMAFVEKNGKVDRGQTIALVGNTGRSTAPHLHYEVVKDGKNINPIDLILPEKKTVWKNGE